jgi:hypothetical protein
MPAYDASIWDRIAELETRLRAAESELIWTRRRLAERQTAVLTRPAITVETEEEPSYPPYADGEADLPVITLDVHELGTPAEWEHRYAKSEITAASRTWLPPGTPVEIAHDGVRWRIMAFGTDLIEFCLAVDHPGRGEAFDVYLGTWNPDDHDWCFGGDLVKAIDWRYDVPYPDAGARGHGYFRESTEHGRILIPIDMDCDTPGTCPACNGGS